MNTPPPILSRSWLPLEPARRSVTSALLEYGLIKHDPAGTLPLKSGGTTDLYANLRDCRSNPAALRWLASTFASPIERLIQEQLQNGKKPVSTIVDIPSAMSPVIGVIAAEIGLKIFTIRDVPKPGRVEADTIGRLDEGDVVLVLDDVMTDGASKVKPIETLRKRGFEPVAVMVLVDRDQGWRTKPEDTTFLGVPVWSGLRLDDIRAALRKG
jgi:orotate phosphoribosyltransferase